MGKKLWKDLMIFTGISLALWVMGNFSGVDNMMELHRKLFPMFSPRDVPYTGWVDFLLCSARGAFSDETLVLYSLFISAFIGFFVPPVFFGDRLGKYISVFLTTIPYFIILVSVMFAFPDNILLLFSVLGGIVSARLMILLTNKYEDIEKDEYVLFMAIPGRSRYSISLRFSSLQAMESVFPTLAWNFTTLLTFTTFLSFMQVGGSMRVSLGGYLRLLYDNFNGLAIVMRGDLGVMFEGLSRYLPAIVYFVLLNYSFHVLMEDLRTAFLKHLGASPSVRRKRSGGYGYGWKRIEGMSIEKVVIISNFTSKPILAFEGNLDFKKGDTVLITGESGMGKTLFVSSISGMLRESKLSLDAKVIFKTDLGDVEISSNFEGVLKSGLIEFIPQNPRESFDKYTRISDYLKDIGVFEDVKRIIEGRFDTDRKKVSDDLEKYPSEVSDGVLQLINLSLLYVRARKGGKILILDEPMASLSLENVEKSVELIKELLGENVVFWIDHDPAVMRLVGFNRYLRVIREGEISTVRETTDLELEGELSKKLTVREAFEEMDKTSGEEILTFEIRKIKFPGGKELSVDHGSRVNVERGGVYFIVGDNGAGKTSLLKVLVGYYRDFEGDAVYRGVGSVRRKRRDVWKIVDILLQNADSSLPQYARITDIASEKGILEILNLAGKENLRVYQLSYGQKKRLMLARIMERKPLVIFLDEPNASLDVDNFLNIIERIRIVKSESHSALIVITHDRDIIPNGARTIKVRGEIA